MAARYSVSTGKVATGAIAAAGTKSLILLNPATDGFSVIELWMSYGAISAQVDIAAELYRVVTIGTPAGTTGTSVKDGNTAATTVTSLINLTTEPTTVEVLRSFYLSVQGGVLIMPFPLGREPYATGAGQRIGLRVINDGGSTMTTVDTRVTVVYEEE